MSFSAGAKIGLQLGIAGSVALVGKVKVEVPNSPDRDAKLAVSGGKSSDSATKAISQLRRSFVGDFDAKAGWSVDFEAESVPGSATEISVSLKITYGYGFSTAGAFLSTG